MTVQSIEASQAPKPVGAYPHAKQVGNLLFLSGIGPRDPLSNQIRGNVYDADGKLVSYDFAAQCEQVFANVLAVLKASGVDQQNLVDVTVFLTDMQRDFPTFNAAWAKQFPNDAPCRTTLGITSLPTPIAIELKCIAVLR